MGTQDWTGTLEESGHGVIPGLLDRQECTALTALYDAPERFRTKVVMAKHGFGRGEYQYFAYPLPERVAALRVSLYEGLVAAANRWAEALGRPARYPEQLGQLGAAAHAGNHLPRCRLSAAQRACSGRTLLSGGARRSLRPRGARRPGRGP